MKRTKKLITLFLSFNIYECSGAAWGGGGAAGGAGTFGDPSGAAETAIAIMRRVHAATAATIARDRAKTTDECRVKLETASAENESQLSVFRTKYIAALSSGTLSDDLRRAVESYQNFLNACRARAAAEEKVYAHITAVLEYNYAQLEDVIKTFPRPFIIDSEETEVKGDDARVIFSKLKLTEIK